MDIIAYDNWKTASPYDDEDNRCRYCGKSFKYWMDYEFIEKGYCDADCMERDNK